MHNLIRILLVVSLVYTYIIFFTNSEHFLVKKI